MAVLHAVAVCLEPVLAGVYLDGSPTGMRLHEPIGLSIVFAGLAQLLMATVWSWRGGTWRAPVAALLMTAGEVTQVAMGYTRQLAIHVPLGITLVAGAVAFAVWTTRSAAAVAR